MDLKLSEKILIPYLQSLYHPSEKSNLLKILIPYYFDEFADLV
jgi:hypothetical protein